MLSKIACLNIGGKQLNMTVIDHAPKDDTTERSLDTLLRKMAYASPCWHHRTTRELADHLATFRRRTEASCDESLTSGPGVLFRRSLHNITERGGADEDDGHPDCTRSTQASAPSSGSLKDQCTTRLLLVWTCMDDCCGPEGQGPPLLQSRRYYP